MADAETSDQFGRRAAAIRRSFGMVSSAILAASGALLSVSTAIRAAPPGEIASSLVILGGGLFSYNWFRRRHRAAALAALTRH